MKPFAIAGVQMNVWASQSNLAEMRRQLDILVQRFPWVHMVVFSELAVCGPLPNDPQPAGGLLENAFCEMARSHGVWLIPGSYFELREDRVFNTAPVIDPQGVVQGRYRKMFPFLPYEEGVTPGHEFLVFDVPDVGRFGLSICYGIVTRMGGEIDASSEIGSGTEFRIRLPIERKEAEADGQGKGVAGSGGEA